MTKDTEAAVVRLGINPIGVATGRDGLERRFGLLTCRARGLALSELT